MKKQTLEIIVLVMSIIFVFAINFIVGLTFDSIVLKASTLFSSAILSSTVLAIIFGDNE